MNLLKLVGALAVSAALAGAAHAERLTDRPLVDTDWVKSNSGNESLVVVDIRAPSKDADFYAAGHIPGAVNAPYGKFGWRTKMDGVVGQLPPIEDISARIGSLGIDNDNHVVIVPHGKSSSDFGAATRVYWTFKVLGHDAVSILDGGMEAWTGNDGELSSDAVAPEVASFTATFQPDLIADADQVAAAQAKGVALVDARPAEQHLGQSKSGVARVAGTIPGAVNIQQSDFYNAENSSYVGKDKISGLVKDAGLSEDSEGIAFCNTGHWASVAWFGLSEVLGNKKTSMYDGSMADWTSDESRPVQ